MASSKKSAKKVSGWNISWTQFFIAASVVLNIAFIVVLITMITSHTMDGMVMNEGLNRYCNTANDDKFNSTPARTQSLRTYTCARGDAKTYFENGFQQYLNAIGQR